MCDLFTRASPLETQVLQLYVAAYQPTGVWREIWKHLVGVLSPQITKDVEGFVQSTPFNAHAFMSRLAAS